MTKEEETQGTRSVQLCEALELCGCIGASK